MTRYSTFLLREDDSNWPKKDIVGKQELEIRIGNDHIAFEVSILAKNLVYSSTHWFYTFFKKTAKIGSLVDIQDSEDPEGLRVFYYLVQDLKVGVLNISLGFHSLTLVLSVLNFLVDLSALQDQAYINLVLIFLGIMC